MFVFRVIVAGVGKECRGALAHIGWSTDFCVSHVVRLGNLVLPTVGDGGPLPPKRVE